MAAANKEHRIQNYQEANGDFRRFLRMTNYSTPAGSSVLFYLFGFHQGSRNHADRLDSYQAFRSTALIGACICGDKLGNLQSALTNCKSAVALDAKDATAHFFLGNVYRDLFNQTLDADAPRCEYLLEARSNYNQTVAINPNMNESVMAKTILGNINQVASTLHCHIVDDSTKL
jgi:tetratricopeptide (TPR) repeat protein